MSSTRWLSLACAIGVVVACGGSTTSESDSKDAGQRGDAGQGGDAGLTDATSNPSTPVPAPGCPAISRPPAIAPLPSSESSSAAWGSGSGATPDLVIDLASCEEKRYFAALPLGSAWVRVARSDGNCEVWLGGETENPMYDGAPAQFCEFQRGCPPATLTVRAGQGGPAHVDSLSCTP